MESCIKENICFGGSELSSTSNHYHLISTASPTAYHYLLIQLTFFSLQPLPCLSVLPTTVTATPTSSANMALRLLPGPLPLPTRHTMALPLTRLRFCKFYSDTSSLAPYSTLHHNPPLTNNLPTHSNGLHPTTSVTDPDATPHVTVRLTNATLREQRSWYVLHWRPSGNSVVLPRADNEAANNKRRADRRAKKLRQRAREQEKKKKDDKDGGGGGGSASTTTTTTKRKVGKK